MAKILGIGIAALDIINTVDGYPEEDSEVRALSQRICRGGNVTNTLVVLSQLGHQCTWGGVYTEELDSQFILQDLANYAIDTRYCRIETMGKIPTSYITLNQRNGSRTIIHYRKLAEFNFSDFQTIDLSTFDWLHFEGRHVIETARMVRYAKQHYPQLPISLELEKIHAHIEQFFEIADVFLFSKVFAEENHYSDAPTFLQAMRQQIPQALLICGWGAMGAFILTKNNLLLHSPAYPPSQVVDTLAAGDTFNAGIIDGLCHQLELSQVLTQACQLAGKKCGQIGLRNLGQC